MHHIIDDSTYEEQLTQKQQRILSQFSSFDVRDIETFKSPKQQYRMRAEFKIWHENVENTNQCHYAMYHNGEYKKPYKISRYDAGSITIARLMPQLLDCLNSEFELRQKCFQVEFLSSTCDEAIITMIYHRKLGPAWESAARQLAQIAQCHVIGRSKQQKIVIGSDWITEKFSVNQKRYSYQQVEASFTQPNAAICEKMLNWVVDQSRGFGGDLLELYCGNGNFTVPMAQNFRRVLATEISKAGVKSAYYNLRLNQVENVFIARMSAEEVSQAIAKVRSFRRLEKVDLDEYSFSTVFVDPPRAGLDENSLVLAAKFDNIIYISCNPTTLHSNLEVLCRTHVLKKLALFDQFPYTDHCECGAILKAR